MHRCFIEKQHWSGSCATPSPAEAHHICHVLRARDGESVRLFDGTGTEATALLHIAEGSVRLEIQALNPPSERGLDIVLIQAILKGNRMDWLIEKATELGVSRIVPVITKRVIPRGSDDGGSQKQERWQRIAVSAAKQCGTPWLPVIDPPTALESAIHAAVSGGPVLVGALAGNPRSLAAEIDRWRPQAVGRIAIVIGPEGDLTPEETDALLEAGCIPVSFGTLVLRAETAALFAISALGCMLNRR
ncbi:MAG TPA: hypothetical protein DCS43_09330 [Verrucomicrobia bacterium]|nr:hypothetical protein [Verrucomicrobiota bacterium]